MNEHWATFDCYGTLADWIGGMSAAVEPYAGDRTSELMEAYFEIEFAVEHEMPWARYREILAETLTRACAQVGVEVPRDVLAQSWRDMPIFEDTRPALEQLRADGWRLAILTNCDDDLIAMTVDAIGVDFDEIVTAQQVGSYKPAHGHWMAFDARTEGRRDVHVHVAQSYRHDMIPARELGLPRIWIDRTHDGSDPAIVDVHLHDLRGLPQALSAFR